LEPIGALGMLRDMCTRHHGLMRATAVLLFAVASRNSALAQAQDSIALIRKASQAELQFFERWRRAWTAVADRGIERAIDSVRKGTTSRAIEDRVHPVIRLQNPTYTDGHCHIEMRARGNIRIVESSTGQHSCPNWIRESQNPAFDTNFVVAPIAQRVLRDSLAREFTTLGKLFDSVVHTVPGDAWASGQRVRIKGDGGDWAGALAAARECRVSRWWCASLQGYALARGGDYLAADSVFSLASASLSGDARCQWSDFRALLDPSARAEYDKTSCAVRDSLNRTIMWLADPLFSRPGNERRADQFVRQMHVFLHSALPRDELYEWASATGGDALAETIRRYGIPVRISWMGNLLGLAHEDDYLKRFGKKFISGTPYLSAEYPRRSAHTIPSWDAISKPFGSRTTDWRVWSDTNGWWPQEHFVPTAPLIQIDDDQYGLFRRENASALYYSTDLRAGPFARLAQGDVTARVVGSPAPDSVIIFLERTLTLQSRLTLSAMLPVEPVVAGLEVQAQSGAAARSRFGLIPLAPLSQMASGNASISDIVLVDAPADDMALTSHPDSILRLMMPTTRIRPGQKKVGVYWEVYGYAASDSVEVALRIQRHTSQGVIGSLAIALNIFEDRNAPVAVTWSEPNQARNNFERAGKVPTVSRSVVVDVGSLPAGDYWLDIAVRKRGSEPLIRRREFTITQ
jgi:hypothetical protein